jgi:hypothetical protein
LTFAVKDARAAATLVDEFDTGQLKCPSKYLNTLRRGFAGQLHWATQCNRSQGPGGKLMPPSTADNGHKIKNFVYYLSTK